MTDASTSTSISIAFNCFSVEQRFPQLSLFTCHQPTSTDVSTAVTAYMPTDTSTIYSENTLTDSGTLTSTEIPTAFVSYTSTAFSAYSSTDISTNFLTFKLF